MSVRPQPRIPQDANPDPSLEGQLEFKALIEPAASVECCGDVRERANCLAVLARDCLSASVDRHGVPADASGLAGKGRVRTDIVEAVSTGKCIALSGAPEVSPTRLNVAPHRLDAVSRGGCDA